MQKAPETLRTMIVSGDVYIRAEKPLQTIPEADVVCYGLWVDASLASHHGVFLSASKTTRSARFYVAETLTGRTRKAVFFSFVSDGCRHLDA